MSARKTEPLNTVIVSQASDLPFNSSAGEHILEDGTLYRFDGFVSSTAPIRVGTQTPLIGGHASIDGFIYTAGSGTALVGGTGGLFMRNMYMHSPGTQLFGLEGDISQDILVEACSFSDAAGLGAISNLGRFDGFRAPTFFKSNFEDFGTGLSFGENTAGGAPRKVFINGSPFRNVTQTGTTILNFDTELSGTINTVSLSNNYFKNVQTDTQIVNVESGATPGIVFQYFDNFHDNTVTKSNILNGDAGQDVVGYNVVGSFPLQDSTAILEATLDAATTTTINNQNTFVPIEGSITAQDTERFETTATNGEVRYIGRKDQNVLVLFSASVSGANGNEYEVSVSRNGSVKVDTGSLFTTSNNLPVSVSFSGVLNAVQNDTYRMQIQALNTTDNPTFNKYTLNVSGV